MKSFKQYLKETMGAGSFSAADNTDTPVPKDQAPPFNPDKGWPGWEMVPNGEDMWWDGDYHYHDQDGDGVPDHVWLDPPGEWVPIEDTGDDEEGPTTPPEDDDQDDNEGPTVPAVPQHFPGEWDKLPKEVKPILIKPYLDDNDQFTDPDNPPPILPPDPPFGKGQPVWNPNAKPPQWGEYDDDGVWHPLTPEDYHA